MQEPPRERGEFGISLSGYEIKERKQLWTAIRMRSGLVVDEHTHLSEGANDNVITTDVRRRGEKTTTIVNIYDQKHAQLGETERPVRKLNWQRVIG